MQDLLDLISRPEIVTTIALLGGTIAVLGAVFLPSKKGQIPHADETEATVSQPEESALTESLEEVIDQPEALNSRAARLRARLARSGAVGKKILALLTNSELSAAHWEEIEETLIAADLGLDATDQIMQALKTQAQVHGISDPEATRQLLRSTLLKLVGKMDRSLALPASGSAMEKPSSILVVGVNGVGKTTAVGKLARILVAENKKVVLGAADTFRAAAADQLQTWGERVDVEVVRSEREGADPAAVAFEAVRRGQEVAADVVLVDTAGRLHNKSDLMAELGKIRRVLDRGSQVAETLLVLDATTGQNGMAQARIFAETAQVTGIILTKLDGSAKGGMVVAVQKELGVPVKFVGLGEGADDMAPFDPEIFVDSILGL